LGYVRSVREETKSKVETIGIGKDPGELKGLRSDIFYIVYDERIVRSNEESERYIFEYLQDNPYALLIYGDEDYFVISEETGDHNDPQIPHAFRYFKPAFSPETLTSFDYINTFAVRGDILIDALENINMSDFSDSLIYVLLLEIVGIIRSNSDEDKICHISAILSSKGVKIPDKDYKNALKTGRCDRYIYNGYIKEEPLFSNKKYKDIRNAGALKMGIVPQKKASVSLIIPSKDNPDMLRSCINRLDLNEYEDIEVIVVDNGSCEENRKKIEGFLDSLKCRHEYIYEIFDFNYSKMNNMAVKKATKEVLLLLNDDIEADGCSFIEAMAAKAMQKEIGCVGVKLLYPTGEIQHVGIVGGVDGPAHIFMGEKDDKKLGHGENLVNRNVLAVTGACLAVRRELYESVGGLCEELKVGYNDVDLCMTLYEKGFRNVCLNEISLIHHESVSRGMDAKNALKSQRLKAEKEILKMRHKDLMISDPYSNGGKDFVLSFSRKNEDGKINAKCELKERKANDDEGWIYSSFEKIEIKNDPDGRNLLKVKGYALVPGIDNMRFDMEMILKKDNKQYVIKYERRLRTDLSGKFPSSANTELSGMEFTADIGDLEKGTYEIYMYAKDHGNVRELISDTQQSIVI